MCVTFPVTKAGLERWLGGLAHLLLFLMTSVRFLAPTPGGSQPPVTSDAGNLEPSLASVSTCIQNTHMHIYIYTQAHIPTQSCGIINNPPPNHNTDIGKENNLMVLCIFMR